MKPNKLLALAIMPVLLLASCGENPTGDNYYRFYDKPVTTTFRQARKGEVKSDIPSKGNARVLVVPVEFADFPASDLLRGADGAHEDIEKVYFGESEDTQWESLKSYYYKSSYGNVNISGQVMPWYQVRDPNNHDQWFTTEEMVNGYGTPSGDTGIARLILGWIYNDYAMSLYHNVTDDEGNPYTSGAAFMKDYDADGDGFIDVLEMVYSAPIQHLNSDLFWAFRSSDSSSSANVNRPSICGFVWLSYHFVFENGYYEDGTYKNWTDAQIIDGTAKVDAHTFIHESGHAFGLDDYYTYDSNDWGAMGGTDMMDYNVGDHNAFSKGALGWSNPLVVTGPSTVKVKSFTDTGDAIMLPAYRKDGQVNNTFVDNYILIEYYRPTGVNAMDATNNYAGRYPKMPDVPGIRIYHVDARLGLFTYGNTSGWQFVRYVSTVTATDSNSYIGIANSNTKSFSAVANNKLLHVLEKSGLTTLRTSSLARYSSSMMWQAGDSFGVNTFVNFTLNNGEKLGYKFTVDSMDDEEVQITFSLA